ncbi:MAG: DUF1697 domain-containing protein [Microbacteriaceae bacterium]
MRQVAFLRNVNQGQRGHPSSQDVLGAFRDAGCAEVVCFQSNGTVIFDADPVPEIVAEVMVSLAARSGAEREGFAIPLQELERIVRRHADATDMSRRELTLHSGGMIDRTNGAVVRRAAQRRCVIVDAGVGWVATADERARESNATQVVERITGAPATSRGLPTLLRLLDRFPPIM